MKVLRIVAVVVATIAACKIIETVGGSLRRRAKDSRLDAALADTFPASDPTASQDFGIPANRQ
jgi:hypothetical protein